MIVFPPISINSLVYKMPTVTYIIIPTAVVLYLVRKFREYSWGYYKATSSLKGQVYLITGANCGIGKEAAKQLLYRNATVIMACRDKSVTQAAIEDIRKTTKSGEALVHELDLSSFNSIRKFADEILREFSKIDVLINNAGVSVPLDKNLRTKDGFDLNFGVNHLGHFLLTHLLLPKLKDSAPSRIVIVSSTLHERGTIDFDDLNLDKLRKTGTKHRMSPGYCNSKLANAYHARALATRLKDDQIDVRVLCPGFTYTNLFRNSDVKWWQYIIFLPVAFLFMRSAFQGSQTIVYCATEKNLPGKSGDFYRNCALYQSSVSFDVNVEERLWETSEKLAKIKQ